MQWEAVHPILAPWNSISPGFPAQAGSAGSPSTESLGPLLAWGITQGHLAPIPLGVGIILEASAGPRHITSSSRKPHSHCTVHWPLEQVGQAFLPLSPIPLTPESLEPDSCPLQTVLRGCRLEGRCPGAFGWTLYSWPGPLLKSPLPFSWAPNCTNSPSEPTHQTPLPTDSRPLVPSQPAWLHLAKESPLSLWAGHSSPLRLLLRQSHTVWTPLAVHGMPAPGSQSLHHTACPRLPDAQNQTHLRPFL